MRVCFHDGRRSINIRAQFIPRHGAIGCRLDRKDALGRAFVPLSERLRGDADSPRQFRSGAGGFDCLPKGGLCVHVPFVKRRLIDVKSDFATGHESTAL